MINAAIQDRDIANRGAGKGPVTDDDVMQILAKMVKQREESARAFEDGNRPELAAQERAEIEIIRDFLPKQLDDEAVKEAVQAGDQRDRRARPARHGPCHDCAEGKVCRSDGFRQGERHRQVDAAVVSASSPVETGDNSNRLSFPATPTAIWKPGASGPKVGNRFRGNPMLKKRDRAAAPIPSMRPLL